MKIKYNIAIALMVFGACQSLEQTVLLDEQNSDSIIASALNESYECYYWCDGVKIPLIKDDSKAYAILETSKYDNLKGLLDKVVKSSIENKMSKEHTAIILDKCSLVSIDRKDIIYDAPYFKTCDGSEIGITNVLSVQLNDHKCTSLLFKIAEECNIDILGESVHDPSIYILSCTNESAGNALAMANYIYESGICRYASPEFIIESHPASLPNDTHFPDQWNLWNRSYTGIDINYVNTISEFSFPQLHNVIVAVIDNGIYTHHDDLLLHDVSYNAHTRGYPSGLYGDHGTKVAGVIGALANNNQGIAGVASGVRIMPISVCYTKDGERLNIPASTSLNFEDAIRFAANNGARVINNSWSFDTTNPMPGINAAIQYALNKGSVVVFASGNDSSAVAQPAAGAPSDILITGAINKYGYKPTFSNYSSPLDIVAPGVDIYTTTWTGGYDCPDGTSFAAPHISAIAALMLSVNPHLTRKEVTDIIERTARKLPGYAFSIRSGRPNGTWNEKVGYGLVDCYAAVGLAYRYNEDNYANLIEFDYSGSSVEMSLKIEDDIAIIWDWDTKDISFIRASDTSPVDTTVTHIYSTAKNRHIIVAETVDPGESIPSLSSALISFELTTGASAYNIDIKSKNTRLEYFSTIGGTGMASQTISVRDLPALKDLYLVKIPNAYVVVHDCPSLLRFGSSKYIWGAPPVGGGITIVPLPENAGGTVGPDVVGGSGSLVWPAVPEAIPSFVNLDITDCNNLQEVSLENVNLNTVDFSSCTKLRYLYVTSQSDRIIGGCATPSNATERGEYLFNTISTLQPRPANDKGRIYIKAVNESNSAYVPADVSLNYRNLIEDHATDNNWEVIYGSNL